MGREADFIDNFGSLELLMLEYTLIGYIDTFVDVGAAVRRNPLG